MTRKQRRALHYLSGGAFLAVSPGFAVHMSKIHGVHGDGDDLAVRLFWRDHEDCDWVGVADFTEDALSEAVLTRGTISLLDTMGEKVVLTKWRCVPC
ncbi:MAG: hypothetical protein QME60_02145 [Verrucomicrobiota bacterium]|nr:hypothetical protein [Verrucomicrobiota bacterium]